MRVQLSVLAVAIAAVFPLLAAVPIQAADSAPPLPPRISLPPELDAALRDLSSDNYQARRAATKKLEWAIGDLNAQIASTDDAEALAQVAEVMRTEGEIAAWINATLAQPTEQRKRSIAWGLEPAHLPLVTRAFSQLPEERIGAVQGLGKLTDPEARALVVRLLRDQDRQVHLAAIDALWDQPPSPAIIEALWDRAVPAPDPASMGPSALDTLQFHGQTLGLTSFSHIDDGQDGEAAMQLLTRFHSPAVEQKVIELLQGLRANSARAKAQLQYEFTRRSQAFRAFVMNFKDKKVMTALYELATTGEPDPMGGIKLRICWDKHVAAMAMVLEMTGQNLSEYKFKQVPFYGLVVSNVDEEKNAMALLKTWWGSHGSQYEEPSLVPQPPMATGDDVEKPSGSERGPAGAVG